MQKMQKDQALELLADLQSNLIKVFAKHGLVFQPGRLIATKKPSSEPKEEVSSTKPTLSLEDIKSGRAVVGMRVWCKRGERWHRATILTIRKSQYECKWTYSHDLPHFKVSFTDVLLDHPTEVAIMN